MRIFQFKSIGQRTAGQTLIETIVAIGLLTTGIIAGLAAAISSLGASDQGIQQIVAANLAREGVEVVRKIRDSNWYSGSLQNCDAWFGTVTGQQCYQNWDDGIAGSVIGADYRAVFNPASNAWALNPTAGGSQTRLLLRADGIYSHTGPGIWRYSRLITITQDTAAPFAADNPRLLVRSTVWWQNRRCPAVDSPSLTTCKLVVEEYLTNWKNF